MSFADLLASDASGACASDFGESVKYRASLSAAAVTFNAQVFRNVQQEPIAGVLSKAITNPITDVFIPLDPAGVKGLAAKPETGGGQIYVAQDQGVAAAWRNVSKVMTEDPGGWLVRCR